MKTMSIARKRRLEAAGWKVGTLEQFLGLSKDEIRLIDLKLSLSRRVKRHRLVCGVTQVELAKLLGSSQSRVAKLEDGADGATLDLLFRALFALGVSNAAIAREIHPRKRPAA
jgi:DNA-binding XRE family transcriptional regulator